MRDPVASRHGHRLGSGRARERRDAAARLCACMCEGQPAAASFPGHWLRPRPRADAPRLVPAILETRTPPSAIPRRFPVARENVPRSYSPESAPTLSKVYGKNYRIVIELCNPAQQQINTDYAISSARTNNRR